ncbi:hypothetical protein [Photobacterium kishitanii]|uniref:Uncharacterized protein n=1 Tax=Photobacterium kishitanii TaxID=318456 RepID=A0A2T3KLB8_9GAMM|nr:hypothetical protein [Photobacterium kishitanii]PSV00466.1 hypothetical protein C9J27_04860 [Photobacterium kishitanii]
MNNHQKLVFVNTSANFAYVEIPLDRHVLLKATGNVGKSSTLNAFKLFWLAEVNFTSCERKFKFASRQAESGYYSQDDAFNHYFPTTRSYLILEVENLHGRFCQILYPRPNRSYGRIFAKCAYSEIEHLFWDKENGEDGLGSPNNDLSTTAISAYLEIKGIPFENVTNKERLCQLLYSDSVIDDDCQFSVFPLKNQDKQTIKTFASLVHAMCGAKSDNSELVNMFSSIIEGQKVDHNDILSLDLDKIMQEREELNREASALTKLDMYCHEANTAINGYAIAGGLISVGSEFVAMRNCLDSQMTTISTKSAQLTEKKNEQARLLTDKRIVTKDKRSSLDNVKGELAVLRREYKVAEKKVTEGEEIISEFSIVGIATDDYHAKGGIFELINEDTQQQKENLNVLEDKEANAKLVDQLTKKKSLLTEQLGINQSQLNNANSLLINSVDENAKSVLLSLDNRFAAIPAFDLDETQVITINAFCSLFSMDNYKANLNGIPFNTAQKIKSITDIESDIERLKNDIWEIDSRVRSISNEDLVYKESAINACRVAIAKNNKDIEKLQTYLVAKKELPVKKDELEATEAAYLSAQKELEEANAAQQKITKDGKDLAEKLEELNAKKANVLSLKGRLDQCRNTPCFASLISDINDENVKPMLSVSNEQIDEIARGFSRYQDAFNTVKTQLALLVSAGLIEDEDRATFSNSATLNALSPLVARVKNQFEQVEPRKKILSDNMSSHKSIISMKMQELRGNSRAIAAYKARINRMFEHFKINNLSGVQIDLVLDPRFQNLLEQADRTDLESASEINTAFYERLESFITSFFKGGNKRLTINKIIKSVVFKTRKGDGEWIETGQSNSSVSLIVIPLIQNLMKDMLNPDIGYTIPMPVDEVAHIDPSQIEWLLDMFQADGFTLLGASTHNINAKTLIAINAELNLGELSVRKSYSKERDLVLFGGIEGELL